VPGSIIAGDRLWIKKVSNDTNIVTIVPYPGGDTIEFGSSLTLVYKGDTVVLEVTP
jgi:hypothetical protein